MNIAAIEDAVIAWVRAASGCQAILSKQNGPRPEAPFLTVAITSPERIGHRYSKTEEGEPGNVVQLHRLEKQMTVVVTSFTATTTGNNCARELAVRVIDALSLDSVLEALSAVGLAVRQVGAVVVLDDMPFSKWQGQASADVVFGFADVVSEAGYVIEKFTINGTEHVSPEEE